jgi:DNA mismatch repair protein
MRADRPPPVSEQELLEWSGRLAGRTLRHIADELGIAVPRHLKNSKGWIGELVETCLGASAGPLPEPDFGHLGLELKTLPIGRDGKPRESTFICSVPLLPDVDTAWESSLLKRKLSRVLWVPVEADPELPIGDRRIGSAILWSPDHEQESLLRRDWEELTELVILGRIEQISARQGKISANQAKGTQCKIPAPWH